MRRMRKLVSALALSAALFVSAEAFAGLGINVQLGIGNLLPNITTGINNVAIGQGYSALTTGSNNIVLATNSLCDVASATTSNSAVFCGGATPFLSVTATNTTSPIVAFNGQLSPPSARSGTFTCTSGGTVVITNTAWAVTSNVLISLNTAAGTVSTAPAVSTGTAGTSFSVKCATSDTSLYNYWIF